MQSTIPNTHTHTYPHIRIIIRIICNVDYGEESPVILSPTHLQNCSIIVEFLFSTFLVQFSVWFRKSKVEMEKKHSSVLIFGYFRAFEHGYTNKPHSVPTR